MTFAVQLVGGPTAILEYGGLRWLTDPALSPPGDYGGLTKLTGPAFDITQHDPIDVVLLSHHQHSDNLDLAGRAFLPKNSAATCSAWSHGRPSRSGLRMAA